MQLRRITATDPRLGRHVEHDPRSRAYPAIRAEERDAVMHEHYGRVLNQGDLGSCTGNAMAHALVTAPLRRPLVHSTNEKLAVRLYSRATELDPWDGSYPPDDTGSSGLAVCKAAQEAGYISRYEWAFGVDHARAALVNGPLLFGTVWYERMFEPDEDGVVNIGGGVAGGHEYVCLGYVGSMFHFINSWGRHWGVASAVADVSGGTFWMSYDTVATLLEDQGDVVQPLLL